MSDLSKNLERPFNLLDSQAFEANQRSDITAAQQKKVTPSVDWKRTVFMVLATLIVGSAPMLVFFPIIRNDYYKDLPLLLFIGGLFLVFLLIIGYDLLRQVRKQLKVRRDISNRAIRQGRGHLVHDNQGYFFKMKSGELDLAGNLANGLLPGITYQVYYLAESWAILSASAIDQVTPALPQAALNEILASANHFSTNDLIANRNGEITPAQRRKLIPNIILGGCITFGSMLLLIPFIASFALSNTNTFAASFLGIMIVGIGLIVGFSWLAKSLLDLVLPKPQTQQGLLSRKRRVVYDKSFHLRSRRRIEYYYALNDERFRVDYSAYTALIVGLEYRIYYFPYTKKLIAIEALDGLLQ